MGGGEGGEDQDGGQGGHPAPPGLGDDWQPVGEVGEDRAGVGEAERKYLITTS